MTTPILKELQTFPRLWEKITNSTAYPNVESMISLLKEAGFTIENRPSGSTCIKTIHQYKYELEAFLGKGNVEELKAEVETQVKEEVPKQESIPKQEFLPNVPFDPNTQCECTLESEAIERMKYCIGTSFRTDAGIIMLENDLIMYDDIDDAIKWVQETREAWKNRLHSKIYPEFEEALDLWVAAKQK